MDLSFVRHENNPIGYPLESAQNDGSSDTETPCDLNGLTPVGRKEIRDREIAPSFEEIKKWVLDKLLRVPKSHPTGNALNYFVNEYNELSAFLVDGRYEMDNGWIERVIRKFAIGRNNWLFCDTVEGAHTSAMLYSLTLLPSATTADDYERLVELLLSPKIRCPARKKKADQDWCG